MNYEDLKYYHNLVNQAKEILNRNNVPYSNDITFLTYNSHKNWGRCSLDLTNGSYEIKVAERLISSHNDHSILNTILHELIHTCPNCMCHTGDWKRYATIINDAEGFHIQRCTSAEELGVGPAPYKYKAVCEKCGAESKFYSRVKFIKRKGVGYHCTRCNGHTFHAFNSNGGQIFWFPGLISQFIYPA